MAGIHSAMEILEIGLKVRDTFLNGIIKDPVTWKGYILIWKYYRLGFRAGIHSELEIMYFGYRALIHSEIKLVKIR